ncbi:MAG: von Willebrand factor type A domain-containing protein [Candidatus Omnitrophota bacterium]|jgi:Ca-activated chloride channel family protein
MIFIHSKIKKLISAYLDNEVSEKEKNLVEEHLKKSTFCRKYYENLQKLSSTLNKYREEDLSPDLEQRIKKNFLGEKYKGVAKMKNKKLIVGISSGALAILIMFVFVGHLQSYLKHSLEEGHAPIDEIDKQYSPGSAFRQDKMHCNLTPPLTEETIKGASTQAKIVLEGMKQTQYSARRIKSLDSEPWITTTDNSSAMWLSQSGGGSDSYYHVEEFNTENYERIYENRFLDVAQNPLSTFSIDVDTASYSNIRRFINEGRLPPKDAVRIEEMINYFTYDYPAPKEDVPFSITTEVSRCPWNDKHDLVLVGLQGKKMNTEKMPSSNLVFLIDVSGSMNVQNKLPLLKSAFRLLVEQLRSEDTVSIVVYAGAAGVVLDSASGGQKGKILDAIDRLSAGGSTAGGAGIKAAYKLAQENFIKSGNNRVILATDGDFNVGVSSDAEMTRLIEEEREKGIFLTVLGFGTGNYKDSRMEKIADKGNGNYAYIDNIMEAKKVFVNELGATLFTIAKDVKVQVEFNPKKVKAYKLIGYENRVLQKEDFNDDKKDAGELGAGHSVTALYEIVPADSKEEFSTVDPLLYQKTSVAESDDLLTVKLRYKEPTATESKLLVRKVTCRDLKVEPSQNLQFASAVAETGLLLRDSEYKANASYKTAIERAKGSIGKDNDGYRAEFIRMVETVQLLDNKK